MPEASGDGGGTFCCCCSKKQRTTMAAAADENGVGVAAPKVPFSADLPPNLGPGLVIRVNGSTLPNCSRFAVNLTCGRSPTADIAFHFNPRLALRYVVRNSRLGGYWGNEDTTSPAKFPFVAGRKFLLEIFIADGEFLVAVDGVHLCSYSFRVPLAKVTGIEAHGPVDVFGVDHKKLEFYPESLPGRVVADVPEGPPDRLEDNGPEAAMDSPLALGLRDGFQVGWQLEIQGRVKILPHSFYINLQEGHHIWPHPIIPLHLNPRFSTTFGEPMFVRNAWIGSGWGQEERAPVFQFVPGSPFSMSIRRAGDHFSVWVDGKLVGEFKFRGEVDKIDAVQIQGDVVVYGVYLDKQPGKLLR